MEYNYLDVTAVLWKTLNKYFLKQDLHYDVVPISKCFCIFNVSGYLCVCMYWEFWGLVGQRCTFCSGTFR